LARARKSRAFVTTAPFARLVVAGFAEFRPAEIPPLVPISVLSLLPRLLFAPVRTIVIAALPSRSIGERPISLHPIAASAKSFAMRGI
jgi:hypothetical protein